MVRVNLKDLTPTQVGILALSKATDKGGREAAPIPGRIHLVKELFAIHSTPTGGKLFPDLRFEADNFGPFDEAVFQALDELQDAGLLKQVPVDSRQEIRLTESGKALADQLWTKLKPEVRDLVSFVKVNYNHRSADAVLHEIYAAFPEMTKNSVSPVADKYRTKAK